MTRDFVAGRIFQQEVIYWIVRIGGRVACSRMLATPDLTYLTDTDSASARLGERICQWVRTIPLYAEHAASLQTADGRLTPEALAHLPYITKEDIRRNFPRNFLGPNIDIQELLDEESIELEHTSGTSEPRTPLILESGWWNAQEARALRLNRRVAAWLDSAPHQRRVTINSPNCSNDICYTGVPSKAQRTIGDALHTSLSKLPFLWSNHDLERMAKEAVEWDPLFLDVDPVYGVVFARYCEANGVRLRSLKFIIASYEYVSVVHRRVLERAFGVPVFNLYGSTETGHLLMETSGGMMRPQRETAFLQTMDEDENGVAELVVTTLTNNYMPLLRYRIGDLVKRNVGPEGDRYVVHGRAADAVRRPDGTRATVWHLDQCFSAIEGVAHYQIIESTDRAFHVRYVADGNGPTASDCALLQERIAETLGPDSRVRLEQVDLLMPENSGKFRLSYPLNASV